MSSTSIRVYHAAMDVDEDRDSIILRGVIDAASLRHLRVAEYQREVMPLASIAKLAEAFKSGSVPDGELGMRGDKVVEKNGAVFLHDPVYIIDGLQRVTAAMHVLSTSDRIPRFGAQIHLNTNEIWERERFKLLNSNRSPVSPNVMLRNMRHDHESLQMLYTLAADRTFILSDRVSWTQRMKRTELISARTFLLTTTFLHQHIAAGRSASIDAGSYALDRIMDRIGKNVLRDNIRTFYDLIDESWGIRRVAFKEGAVYMRQTFLQMLATMLSRHTNFWKDNRLTIDAPLARKIASFPITDPQIASLASASGKSRDMLYWLMVDHFNSGKRTRRLVLRDDVEPITLPDLESEVELEPHGVQVYA